MSNFEHLIENALYLYERDDITPEEWRERMRDDCNWKGNEHITMDELQQICSYVILTWCGWCEKNENWDNHKCMLALRPDIERGIQMSRIANNIYEYWSKHRELRYGQVMSILAKDKDMFYMTDEELDEIAAKAAKE